MASEEAEATWQICANCKHSEPKNGYQGLFNCHNPIRTTIFRDGLLVEWLDSCDIFEHRNNGAA